jgi:hypothetical protein
VGGSNCRRCTASLLAACRIAGRTNPTRSRKPTLSRSGTGLSRASYLPTTTMKAPALRYYMHDGPTAFRFELAGHLDDAGARRLEQDWRTASSTLGDRRRIVDITFVTGVDEQGHALITGWHRQGAWFIVNSKASRALAEAIVGEPLPEALPYPDDPERTRTPFRTSLRLRAATLVLLATMVFPIEANAATLKPETLAAWDEYLQTTNVNLQDRIRPGGSFLWTLENAGWAAQVRGGEIVVVPSPGQNPKKVPGGLIHHWVGAMLVPNVNLDDVLDVTRDYDHYKELYRPFVIESRVITRGNSNDKFSMLLMNKAFLLKTVLDADYQVTNVRLDDHRFYSISKATRVQEIEEYGHSEEHLIAEGEGHGYIWKLCSIARLEQRDEGVYVELEAIALSRDIPAAARFMVDPIVRRVSRNSLLISLQQTDEAVRGRFPVVAKSGTVPSSGGQVHSIAATPSNNSSGVSRVY